MVTERQTTTPAAFDAFAADYDDNFTNSTLGRLLRSRVWQKLGQYFNAGQHVLELTCGTGEDAVRLAQQGVSVTATDAAAEMLQVTTSKAEAAGVSARVLAQQVSLQQLSQGNFNFSTIFDGVYSNFGGLNTIGEWHNLAQNLSKIVKPGGYLILVPLGPFCPWEIGWHIGHAQPKVAWRRFGQHAPAKIGEAVIPIWYPTAKRLKADFAPWFKAMPTESLGLWLPPTYLDHFVDRWPQLFAKLNDFENRTARLTRSWGDHYIIIFQRL